MSDQHVTGDNNHPIHSCIGHVTLWLTSIGTAEEDLVLFSPFSQVIFLSVVVVVVVVVCVCVGA